MRISIVLAALAASGSVAAAEPTWSPGNTTYGDGYILAVANDGSNYDGDNVPLSSGFGSYSAFASVSGGWASNDMDWDANGSHSDFAVGSTSGTSNEQYYGYAMLHFTALTGGDFDVDVEMDWQGSGAAVVQAVYQLWDITTDVYDTAFDSGDSGPRSISHTSTLVAGREYRLIYYGLVTGTDLIGDGTGSGDILLNAVPLPSGAALAGLGLLGLGVRRRRVSL